MPTMIKQIIEYDEADDKSFARYQQERLEFLSSISSLPEEEQEKEREKILEKMKRIGIIDDNCVVTEKYSAVVAHFLGDLED